jgi:hypothetical protein
MLSAEFSKVNGMENHLHIGPGGLDAR